MMAWLRAVCPAQLPDYCATFSSIQGQGMSLPSVNSANASNPLYTPLAPSPPGYWPQQARCNAGPCINACCTVGSDGFCLDNLLAQGGHYMPSEAQSLLAPCARAPLQFTLSHALASNRCKY